MSCPKSHSQLVCLQPFSNDLPSRPPDLTAQPSLPLRPAPDKSPWLDGFLSGLWLTCQSLWPSPETVTLWLSSILEKIPELPGMDPQAASIQPSHPVPLNTPFSAHSNHLHPLFLEPPGLCLSPLPSPRLHLRPRPEEVEGSSPPAAGGRAAFHGTLTLWQEQCQVQHSFDFCSTLLFNFY